MIQEFSPQGIFWNADHRAETGLIQGKVEKIFYLW